MRQAALIAVLLVSGFSMALGISKSYDVVPYGNCVAEIVTAPNGGITQYYRNTLDSLTLIRWWCGDTFSGGLFNVEVRDSATPAVRIAYNASPVHAAKCWAWLDFPLVKDSPPVRGRTYKVTITNQSQNPAISFAYDPTNPYKYGKAVVNNGPARDTSRIYSGSSLACKPHRFGTYC
jgi:hypothetical protein